LRNDSKAVEVALEMKHLYTEDGELAPSRSKYQAAGKLANAKETTAARGWKIREASLEFEQQLQCRYRSVSELFTAR
jgi:hypothetical protein